jgi:hypothetical protein
MAFELKCGVCGYIFPMQQGPHPDMLRGEGALWCSKCNTVMIYENDAWTPVGDSELAAKIRQHIAQVEAYKKERERRLRWHALN